MRKILCAFVLISVALLSCDKSSDSDLDDLKKENQELKDALAANSKITNVEFSETEMILTYSNGLKLTSPIPDVLKGEAGDTPRIGDNGNWWVGDTDTGVIAQGQNGSNGNSPYIGENGNWWISESDTGIAAMGKDGADGVGIKSITYDPSTGMMTITLTNDQETKFVVASNGDGDLSAKILEDLNGKYLMTKATMGDIPYAVVEYNDENQITKITSYTANGYQLLKSIEVEKAYENGKPNKIITRRYATEKTVKYENKWGVEQQGYEEVILSEDKGSEFIEENQDGTYSYFDKYASYNSEYTYRKYFATKGARLDDEIINNGDGSFKLYYFNDRNYYRIYKEDTGEYDTYYYYMAYDDCLVFDNEDRYEESLKVTNNVFKIYRHKYGNEFNVSGELVTKHIYQYSKTRTITGVYELGALMNESHSTIEYKSNGKVDKIYEVIAEGEEASSYAKNIYDIKGNNIQTDQYFFENGKWAKDDYYISHEYTAQNLLSKSTEHLADGSENDILKVIYDNEGNPIEIFKYFSSVNNEDFYDEDYRRINPDTGLRYNWDDIAKEAGLYSYVNIDYNYNMKNFLGNTISAVFPELYGFNFNNAIKNIAVSNTMRAGFIDYKDFNDGGYPQIMEYIISGDAESASTYAGQIKLEYKKID